MDPHTEQSTQEITKAGQYPRSDQTGLDPTRWGRGHWLIPVQGIADSHLR